MKHQIGATSRIEDGIQTFGLCYQCKDGLHGECVGIPCECYCPIPIKVGMLAEAVQKVEKLESELWDAREELRKAKRASWER